MRLRLSRLIAGVALAAIPTLLPAQWPDRPTPNVPKLADGKPNMEGPVPKTADGHPDLSGIWDYYRERPANRPANAPPRPAGGGTGPGPVPTSSIPFFNIGVTMGGLPFQPWALELREKRKNANNKDNPDAHCLPLGLMQLHLHPQPRKMIQTPDQIVILYEAQGGVRQIFTDGRQLPQDPEPWWYGYSIGHWDGDTLVVETNGFRDDVWLDVEGSPLTSSGKMIERFRRVDFGHLKIDVTVDDPKAYTKPWTVTVNQKLLLNTQLIEFVCNENERDDSHLTAK